MIDEHFASSITMTTHLKNSWKPTKTVIKKWYWPHVIKLPFWIHSATFQKKRFCRRRLRFINLVQTHSLLWGKTKYYDANLWCYSRIVVYDKSFPGRLNKTKLEIQSLEDKKGKRGFHSFKQSQLKFISIGLFGPFLPLNKSNQQ